MQTESNLAPALLVQREEDRTNYLCEAELDGHVWSHRKLGAYGTAQISLTRFHDNERAGLSLIARNQHFDFHLALSATEARELAAALTQAAFEQALVDANARREAA